MRTPTALQALAQHPLSFLRSRWPWRSLAYLLSSAVLGVAVVIVAVSISLLEFVPLMVTAGLAAAGLLVAPVTGFERWRLRLVDPAPPARAPEQLWRKVGLRVALVPLGIRLLKDGPAPRWWAFPLALGMAIAAVLLGMAG